MGTTVRGFVVVGLAIATIGGFLFVIVWLKQESSSDYARNHVQALFVDGRFRRTGTVTNCVAAGVGNEPATRIWACRIKGAGCTRTLKFAVNREYGTAPYDGLAADATANPCRLERHR
jgi:hypothetical protein